MKFYGIKYNLILFLLAVFFAILDIFLIIYYGFTESFLLIYVLIGIIPVCTIFFIVTGMGPNVYIDNGTRTIKTNNICDERMYINGKKQWNLMLTFSTIFLDEVMACCLEGKHLLLKMKHGDEKILYLSAFSKKQRLKIVEEITKFLN